MIIENKKKKVPKGQKGKLNGDPLNCDGCDKVQCHNGEENDLHRTTKESEHYRDVSLLLEHLAFNPKFRGDSRVLVFYQDQMPDGYRKLTSDERILMSEILSHSPVYVEIWMEKLKGQIINS